MKNYVIQNVKSHKVYPLIKNVINIYEMDYKHDPSEKMTIYSDGILFYFRNQKGKKIKLLYAY